MALFRHITILALLALVAPVMVCCGQRTTVPSAGHTESVTKQNGESTLSFDNAYWDFGTIDEAKGSVAHTFVFTNTGTNAVVLENVSVSCGCTTPEYSKAPILPGKSSKIKISYDPANRPGKFAKDIYIVSNGSKNRNIITVSGNVTPRPRTIEEDYPFAASNGGVRFNMTSANFGHVEHGTPKSMTISYINNSDREFPLEFDMPTHSNIVSISAPPSLCPRCSGDITITILVPQGGIYGEIRAEIVPIIAGKRDGVPFKVVATATDNFEAVRAKGAPAPEVRMNASFFNVGEVKRKTKSSREFVMTNVGTADLIIRMVESKAMISVDLKAGTVVKPGESVKFTATLSSGEEFGFTTQSIYIISNDPNRPSRSIRLGADVKQ